MAPNSSTNLALGDVRRMAASHVTSFLEAVNYTAGPEVEDEVLRFALIHKGRSMGVFHDDEASRKPFETALSVASNMYPLHPQQVQVAIGMFTWIGFIIDDGVVSSGLEPFQQHLIHGSPQQSSVLDAFIDVLQELHKYYDPIVANFITESALAFVNANALEQRTEYQDMAVPKQAIGWPYYFRGKEGLSEAYAYFCFPKALSNSVAQFLPAIPDLGIFINLTNDLLSFYKEELAGESRNYIHKKAGCEEKGVEEALASAQVEARAAYTRVGETLQDHNLVLWEAFAIGYVRMHVTSQRYRLAELSLGMLQAK